jgi:hypothetical protein
VATTTNFGWTTPDNTGYVKDGALAIRTLGNGVDTSMVGLKGGTTGQVLKKNSGTDMYFVWGTVSSTPRIGQVIQTAISSSYSTSSSTFADATNWTATITPTLATSKILVMYSSYYTGTFNMTAAGQVQSRIIRDSSVVFSTVDEKYFLTFWSGGGTSTSFYVPVSQDYLDSPATTSAVNYKVQLRASNNSGSLEKGTLILMEILV